MTETVLKDTSLCAIIRDEMINPAGGIERFVRAIVPHVEQAVILDTGSVDGTREKLEDLQREFPVMKVHDRPFDNYIDSRNASLKKVKTKWTLILDADELITQSGFAKLAPVIEDENIPLGFSFNMRVVTPDRKTYDSDELHNPRLFQNKRHIKYYSPYGSGSGEYLYTFRTSPPMMLCWTDECKPLAKDIRLYHFDPTKKAIDKKSAKWYELESWQKAPSTMSGFRQWKRFNPKRNRYN